MEKSLSLKKRVYESKKARDILDEEFVEFGPKKRSAREFFKIYSTKFYNILKDIHKFFAEESLKYIVDYTNPNMLILQGLIDQKTQTEVELNSYEKSHPILPNNSILKASSTYYYVHSGKKRAITSHALLARIKQILRHKDKHLKNCTIAINTDLANSIDSGPDINKEEDLWIHLYTINTGRELPS